METPWLAQEEAKLAHGQALRGVVSLKDRVAGTAAGAEEGGEQGAVSPGRLAHPRLRKFVHLQGHGPGGCGLSVDQ